MSTTPLLSKNRPATAQAPRRNEYRRVLLKRFVSCLFGGFVLAMMWGTQEGSQTDFGISFRDAVLKPRIVVFLGIGVVLFALITFWSVVRPYVRRPGVLPLGIGFLIVVLAQTVMNWYDPMTITGGDPKYSGVHAIVDQTAKLNGTLTASFFDWLSWTLVGAALVIGGLAIVLRIRALSWLTAAIGIAGAVIAYDAHHEVVHLGGGIDHSLGVYADMIGFLVTAGAGLTAALSRLETADWRAFLRRIMEFRPGLPFAVLAVIVGLLAYLNACWFSPDFKNDDFAASGRDYKGTAISSLASSYLGWLGWTLFGVTAAVAIAAAVLRTRKGGYAAVVLGIAGIACTFFSLQSMTDVAAKVVSSQGAKWQNLGTGGFLACIAFAIFVAAGIQLITSQRRGKPAPDRIEPDLPMTRMIAKTRRSSVGIPLLVVGVALALFYPPMLTDTWQNVLVSQVGVYVLLALGLNVVVGWAGLLDLGYIAFYEVGAYTTAYLVGALPVKPPKWFPHMSPLETIPFSIIACLIAGILLGAPTLRLRGDYLAIVTLGFGEIVQILSINLKSITGGPQGPNIPHPHIHIGSFEITWGQDNLPYWYLLLVMLVIVIVLFYRLEGSRLGRAWAAIREDEVAAQASGVNTVRVKLLAFAIGASTSALAGTFFASQVGYFDPTLFTLQASILIVAYVVFGGMGSLPGAMAGAAVLTWLPQFLKAQVPQDDRQMWVGAAVLAMMIFRPAGLLPAKRRRAELEGMEGLEGAASSEVTAVPSAGAL